MQLHSNYSLQSLNTLAVPAVAEYFVECNELEDLQRILKQARQENRVWRILGGGSNVVLGDFLQGYTIKLNFFGVTVVSELNEQVLLQVAAGENWHGLVEYCVERGYCGLENLALIPGCVGAAPIQNIGAYGVELCDFVEDVEVLDTENEKVITLKNAECQFSYRESIFKKEEGQKYIVLSVRLKLTKQSPPQVTYPALQAALKGNAQPTIKDVFAAVIAIRNSKLPRVEEIPNVGSFFKNPLITEQHYLDLQARFANIPGYRQENSDYKVPAAWLIDQLGWKGQSFEGAAVHKEHALVLTNPLKKQASAILSLAEAIKTDVKAHFNICLEQEPRIIR